MPRRLIRNSKLTNRQPNELVKYSALGVPASLRQHIDGVEDFRGSARIKLKSYHGVGRRHFYLYLKEIEFRFGHREAADVAALIKKTGRKHQAVLD